MIYPKWMNKRLISASYINPYPSNVTFTVKALERYWPMWMNKGYRTYWKTYQVIPGGSGGGGGFTVAYRDREIPKVTVKRVILLDEYDKINITVERIIDLSLMGGN